MSSIAFTVPGQPQGKARARTFRTRGVTRTVTPGKTVLYENLIKVSYMEKYGDVISFREGPVQVEINAFFGVPKSTSKKKSAAMIIGDIKPTKKPDADNIAKAVLDAMNGIVYHDDTQVCRLVVSKYYSDQPRIEVQVSIL